MDKKILSKTDFMELDPNTVILQAVSFDKKVLGTTTYLVEVGVTHKDEQQYY
jgi:hypothetical protein